MRIPLMLWEEHNEGIHEHEQYVYLHDYIKEYSFRFKYTYRIKAHFSLAFPLNYR